MRALVLRGSGPVIGLNVLVVVRHRHLPESSIAFDPTRGAPRSRRDSIVGRVAVAAAGRRSQLGFAASLNLIIAPPFLGDAVTDEGSVITPTDCGCCDRLSKASA
jgi:hypothetical protein